MHTSLKLQMLSAAAALVIGGGVAQADYAAAVLADNPLAYYRLQETDLSDSPVNAATGSTDNTTYGYEGDTTYLAHVAAGPITGGTALRTNNPRNTSTSSTDFGFLDVDLPGWGNAYTVEMWFKADVLPGNKGAHYLFSRTTGEPGDSDTTAGANGALLGEGLALYGGDTGTTTAAGITFANIVDGEPKPLRLDVDLNTDNWYYVALTRTGGEATDTVTIYLKELLENGTVGFEDSISYNEVIGTAADGTTTAAFGARRDQKASLAFSGDIAEVAIYNTVLTEGQINAHFGAAIPEPGSLLLLGAGATMMLYRRRTVS